MLEVLHDIADLQHMQISQKKEKKKGNAKKLKQGSLWNCIVCDCHSIGGLANYALWVAFIDKVILLLCAYDMRKQLRVSCIF